MKPTFSIGTEFSSAVDKVFEREIDEFTRALDAFPGKLLESIGHKVEPYLFGSAGRRIAYAISDHGISDVSGYGDLTFGRPNMPRSKKSGIYDLDIALSDRDISWSVLADISAQESMRLPHVYLDPHLLRVQTIEDVDYMLPGNNYGETVPIMLSYNNLHARTGTWRIPDVWTQFAITASYASVRLSDITELKTLSRYLINSPLQDHPNKEVAMYYVEQYITRFGPILDSFRAVYMSLFSAEFRDKIQIRNRLTGRKLREPAIYNYEKKDPVYF